MARDKDISAFEARLGHVFADRELIGEALTHASFGMRGSGRDNQRLEFLGDRVLGLVMAEALLQLDETAVEGVLAPRLNAMVRKETCAEVAVEIAIGDVMRLGRSEMLSGGRRKTAILGDAMEAVIAAVYLDAGYDRAREVILALWGNRVVSADEGARDAKTALQEWAQGRGLQPPEYIEVSRKGPDHAPTFVIEARLETGEAAQAAAKSKRAAQQEAAATLLQELDT